jgi:hypothetical protein
VKIGLDDSDLMKKYRVQTRNYHVCSRVEDFTCGSNCIAIAEDRKNWKTDYEFGISKQEMKVSNRLLMSSCLGIINGGS